MSLTNSDETIEALYTKYRKDIFKSLIWAHLFDDDVRYEDKDIFEKTEIYVREFFISQGIEWNNENREIVHSLVINSENAKRISDYFQKSYQQCLTSKLEWSPDTNLRRMINQLIDASIRNNTKLSYYYAKRLLAKYYYDQFTTVVNNKKIISSDKLIVNLMAISFTYNDIKRLLLDVNFDFENLISKAFRSWNEIFGEKIIGPKVFIRNFVMLRGFHVCLQQNSSLKDQLINSHYAFIYKDILDEIEKSVEKLSEISGNSVQQKPAENLQNVDPSVRTNIKDGNASEIAFAEKTEEQQKSDEKTKLSSEKKNSSNEIKTNLPNGIEVFLSMIGREKNPVCNPLTEVLNDSKEIIRRSEECNNIGEVTGSIYFKEELYDAEIEELQY